MYARKNRGYFERNASSAVVQVRIDEIRPNRAQPRMEFDTNSIIRLADSIRRYGILQPLSVRRTSEEGFLYELIAGERRLRAARSLGYLSVPCIVVEADEKLSAELAIIENLLREDLNMFEEAYGFRQLIDNYSMTQEEIARKISLSQSAVANKLRLLRLSFEEQQKIIEYGLTERHARALLRVSLENVRLEAIEHIHKYRLNVISTEQYIDRLMIENQKADLESACEAKDDFNIEKLKKDVISALNRKFSSSKSLERCKDVYVNETEENLEIRVLVSKHAPSSKELA